VEVAVLLVDAADRLHARCAALGARLVEDAGPIRVAWPHRALAAPLLRRASLGGAADDAALADQLVLAGPVMPSDARLAAMAESHGANPAVSQQDPKRMVRWIRMALWHVGAGPEDAGIHARLLPLLVRTGRYNALAEAIASVPRDQGFPPDLTAAAALVERRLVEIIRDEPTNRQIAVALNISEKTVEYHLTRIFARTGCPSRVELAAASLSRLALERTPGGASPAVVAPTAFAGLGGFLPHPIRR
jgi:DNA-binding CsgD family transcriptional regulator